MLKRLSHAGPLFLLQLSALMLLLMFFTEVRGLIFPGYMVSMHKREIFILELLFIVLVLVDKRVRFPSLPSSMGLFKPLIAAWLLWAFVAAVLGEVQVIALVTFAEHLTLLLFAICLYALIDSHRWLHQRLDATILVGFLLYCIFFYFTYFAIPLRAGAEYPNSLREYGFLNVRHAGYYLSVILTAATWLCYRYRFNLKVYYVWLGLVSLIAAWAGVFWLGGRGPFFAYFVSLLIFLMLVRPPRAISLAGFALLLMMLGGVFSTALPGGYGIDFLLNKTKGESVSKVEGDALAKINRYGSGRLAVVRACQEEVAENLWFGVGQNGYYKTCGAEFGSYHPHAFYLQSILDWGIPGALFFIGAMLWLLRASVSEIKANGAEASVNAGAVWSALSLAVFSMIDGTLYYRFTLMFFAVYVVMAIYPHRPAHAMEHSERNRNLYGFLLLVVVALVLFARSRGYLLFPEYIRIEGL